MSASRFIFTDLASEAHDLSGAAEGVSRNVYDSDGFSVTDIRVTDERGADLLGRPVGSYITIDIGRLWEQDGEECMRAARTVSRHLNDLMHSACKRIESVLVCGLGNRSVTPDAIGPFTADTVTVTRHIREETGGQGVSPSAYDVSAISPGVVGQTGVETAELMSGVVKCLCPSLVIAVDALAARSVSRLATTVQMTDTGIRPGSGIGQKRRELSRETLGVPVIALGVPTVTSCQTIIYDALSTAGTVLDRAAERELDRQQDFFVSLNESDLVVRTLASVLSSAIDMTLLQK